MKKFITLILLSLTTLAYAQKAIIFNINFGDTKETVAKKIANLEYKALVNSEKYTKTKTSFNKFYITNNDKVAITVHLEYYKNALYKVTFENDINTEGLTYKDDSCLYLFNAYKDLYKYNQKTDKNFYSIRDDKIIDNYIFTDGDNHYIELTRNDEFIVYDETLRFQKETAIVNTCKKLLTEGNGF